MSKVMCDSCATSHNILMARFQRSLNIEAFQQIVSHYSGPALGIAQKILSDHILAEDAVQEAFLRVVRCRHQYDTSKPFSLWFYTILRNICKDMLRQRTRHIKVIGEIADRLTPAIQNPTHILSVQDFLQILPASEQIVLTLRIIHDLPFRDIAAVVGITIEAAKKRAQRGLRTLRKRMHESQFSSKKADIRILTD